MKTKSMLKLVVGIVVVVGLGGIGYGLATGYFPRWINSAPDSPPEGDAAAAAPVKIQVAEVKQLTLRPTLRLVGTVIAIPERTAMVSPQIGGWVEKLAVVPGQTIKKGELLVQLDTRAAKSGVDRARAVVAEKESALKRLKRGYLPQEVEVAKQDRDKAHAAVDGLRSEMQALDDLLKRREVSQVQYDTKAKAFAAAEAALASADAHFKLIQEGTPVELLEEAQALLDATKADLEHAELTLEWCTINSPISGMVTQLLAHQGQYFDRAVPLATVVDMSKVFVQLRIPSREFDKIALDSRVEVQLNSIPGRTFDGFVSRISGEADPLTGNVVVFASIKNDDLSLRPGLSCEARVFLPEIPDAIAVPVAAIADHSGTPVVTVIRDGAAHEVEVETGAETEELVQVLKGLNLGDMVATAGGYGLPEGCPVQVVADLAAPTAGSR
ncbi:MAG: efflux RND transporter periplasmic adaptor subunit [Planctomycetaceae bacterium]